VLDRGIRLANGLSVRAELLNRGFLAYRRGGGRALAANARRHALWQLSALAARGDEPAERVQRAIDDLRRRAAGVSGAEAAYELASTFVSAGIRIWPWQIRSELVGLLALLERDPPRTVLELGTAEGGTLFTFTRVAADDAVLISIDLPEGRFGGGYPAWRTPLYKSFAHACQRVELIRADSHEAATITRVKAVLDGRPLDFLFVDGDHSYEGVKRDFDVYAPLVRPAGRIAFHDIVPGRTAEETEALVGGVPRFWSELRHGRQVEELVYDRRQVGLGVGVLTV
jgi:predicted O-methyltransferase YrrM